MNAKRWNLTVSVLALAVQGALSAMAVAPLAAHAADDADTAALINPTSTIELGAEHVSGDSAKFGEYNGLNKSGSKAIGNFDIRGGDSYGRGSGTSRWSLYGNDLGTTSREFGGSIADQGQWSLGLKFDELRHNITDTYQSPYQGSMGGNIFTLPSTFGVINATAKTGSNSQLVGTRNLTAAQQAAFQTYDVSTTRKNSTFFAGYEFNRRWNLQFDYNHLEQSGAKLIAGSSSSVTTGAGAAGAWTAEGMVTLMNPTNYKTDTFTLATNYTGDKGTMTASYFGSLFRDGYDRLYWDNPIGKGVAATGLVSTTLAGGYQPNMLSTMPSNNFGQLNWSGTYALRPGTRLAGGLSYGRGTQNDNYLMDTAIMQPGGTPQTSLNGLVVTKNFNVKLSEQSSRDLSFSLGYKFNERDNKTVSNVYKMIDLGGGNRLLINTPYSYSKGNLEFATDYRIDKSQNLRFNLEREDYKRWCDNLAAAYTVPTGTQVSGPSPAGANCAVVPSSTDDKFGLGYRLKASSDLNLNAGYTHSHRNAVYDHNAITALNDNASPNLTGIVNASDYKGYLAAFSASRVQDLLKMGASWQAAEQVNLTLSGRFGRESYPDSVLGVQSGRSSALNFDAAYSYSENGSASFYLNQQQRQRFLLSGASGNGATDNAISYAALVAPTNIWANNLVDQDQTLGLNVRHKGLLAGKLELIGDMSVSTGKTHYHTDVPYLATCGATSTLSCGDTPEIYSRTVQFKLRANYQIDKSSTVAVGYLHQKLTSNDYFYNAYQYGYTPSTLLPTNQQAPSYSLNVISASYIYNF